MVRLHAAVLASALVAVPPVLGAQGSPGFYVETRVTSVSKGGSGNATTRTHVTRAWTSVGCSRTEGEPFRGDSSAYQLMLGKPTRLFNVVPRDRAVFTADTASMKAIVAQATKILGPTPTRPSPKLLGDGGVILGHRTRKYELRLTTDMTAGLGVAARAPTVTTYWVADDPTDPLVAAHRATLPAITSGAPVATGAGMVLRAETRREWRRDVTQVTTREVVAWRKEVVPASRCAIPAGYKSVDLLADLHAQQSASEELSRLSQSTKPTDRARARALGDSLFKEMQRTLPAKRSLRDDPSAVVIDGGTKKKP